MKIIISENKLEKLNEFEIWDTTLGDGIDWNDEWDNNWYPDFKIK